MEPEVINAFERYVELGHILEMWKHGDRSPKDMRDRVLELSQEIRHEMILLDYRTPTNLNL